MENNVAKQSESFANVSLSNAELAAKCVGIANEINIQLTNKSIMDNHKEFSPECLGDTLNMVNEDLKFLANALQNILITLK